MKFITFWYPTIFHKELTPNKLENRFRIDDGSDEYTYWCTLELIEYATENNKKTHCIKCTSEITNTEKKVESFTITFYNKNIRRNGFATYFCNEEEIPENYRNDFFGEDLLLKPIYHKIKEFYHRHESDNDKDSALTAQCSDNEILIDTPDNVSLITFLENFETMFCKYVQIISQHNLILQEKLILHEEKKAFKLEALIKQVKSLNKLCENALIEYTFCKTLLTSIYNQSFRHNVDLELPNNKDSEAQTKEKELKIEYRRKALNIRNSIRYIENIKYKNQNRQHYFLSEILNEGERSQLMSFILGIMGISYALIFGYKTEIQELTWFNINNWWSIFFWSIGLISAIFLFFNSKFFKKIRFLF